MNLSLITSFLLFFIQSCFGMEVPDPRIRARSSAGGIRETAINMARNAGCLADYHGEVDVQERTTSSCFAGGFITEAIVVPVCKGDHCASVRLRSLARLTFNCDNSPSAVKCS